MGLAEVVSKAGALHGVRASVICPGYVRTPLVDKPIPAQAQEFGISEADVVKNVMLEDMVDGEFTTVQDIAEIALLFASFPSNALAGKVAGRQPGRYGNRSRRTDRHGEDAGGNAEANHFAAAGPAEDSTEFDPTRGEI
jgi:NAD(P)-dependent dehydrogenase (short-subunit alcohol dehydrogenase family)